MIFESSVWDMWHLWRVIALLWDGSWSPFFIAPSHPPAKTSPPAYTHTPSGLCRPWQRVGTPAACQRLFLRCWFLRSWLFLITRYFPPSAAAFGCTTAFSTDLFSTLGTHWSKSTFFDVIHDCVSLHVGQDLLSLPAHPPVRWSLWVLGGWWWFGNG